MQSTSQISQRLKFQQLTVLLAVAQTGSMARAAKHLSISQPVVSRAVAELENVFRVRLFDRSAQGVEPTIYGRALVKRATVILNEVRVSADEIEYLADPTAGELRIGCPEPFAAGIVAATVEQLAQRHPRLSFSIELARGSALVDGLLRERHVDLAIGSPAPPGLDDDLQSAILFHNRPCVVAGLQSAWVRRRKITLAELIDEPWVGPAVSSRVWALLSEACQRAGLPVPKSDVATPACQLTMKLVASGRFVGLSTYAYQYFNARRHSVKVLPVVVPVEPFPVAILTLKNRTISPAAQLFIDAATEIAKPLAKFVPA